MTSINVLLPLLAQHILAQCQWYVDFTSLASPSIGVTVLRNDVINVHVTSEIQTLDVHNLRQVPSGVTEGDYFAYPYYVRARIKCDGALSVLESRSVAMRGVRPWLTVKSQPTNSSRELGKIEVQLLMDQLDFTEGTASCPSPERLCSPVWMAPLPISQASDKLWLHVNAPSVNVREHSLGISLTGFHALDASSNLISRLGSLPAAPQAQIRLLYDAAPNMRSISASDEMLFAVLAPYGSAGSLDVLYSEDEFTNTKLIQLTILDQLPAVYVCSGATARTVYDTASLPDRLLLATSLGLVEMSPTTNQVRLVMARCVTRLVIGHQYGICRRLVGALTNDGRVFYGVTQNGPLSMTELTPCASALSGYTTCEVISLVSGPDQGQPTLLVLIKVTWPDARQNYRIVKYRGSQYRVMDVVMPTKLYYPAGTDPSTVLFTPDQYDTAVAMGTDLSSYTNLTITGMDYMAMASDRLLLWGNRLLISLDGGQSVFLMNEYDGSGGDIVAVTSSRNGYYVIMTSLGQVWLGSPESHAVRQLYPSQAWSSHVSWHDLDSPRILASFFTSDNQLYQLVAHVTGSGAGDVIRRRVPWRQILTRINYQAQMARTVRSGVSAMPTNYVDVADDVDYVKPTSACPFASIRYTFPGDKVLQEAKQLYRFKPPVVTSSGTRTTDRLLVYQAITHKLLTLDNQAREKTYADSYQNQIERWRDEHYQKAYIDYLFHNNLLQKGIHVDLDDYQKIYQSTEYESTQPPTDIFLDKGEVFQFSVVMGLGWDDVIERPNQDVEALRLQASSSDPSRLEVTTRRTVNQVNKTVHYQVILRELGRVGSMYEMGGHDPTLTVTVSVWRGAVECVQHELSQVIINVKIGCSSSKILMLNVDKYQVKLTETNDFLFDCIDANPERPCLYANNEFHPFFDLLDQSSGLTVAYQGNYTLLVVGGGEMDDTVAEYDDEMTSLYNKQNQGQNSLIWGPTEDVPDHGGYPIYNHLKNSISWLCQPYSPCSNIHPRLMRTPEFTFIVQISNRDVDSSTYCDLTRRLGVRVHGLPIDVLRMSTLVTSLTILLICLHIGLYLLCHRNESRLYEVFAAPVNRLVTRAKVTPLNMMHAMRKKTKQQ